MDDGIVRRDLEVWMRYSAALILATTLALPSTALANPYDISLRGLGRPLPNDNSAVERYRLMTSELVLALAPRPLAPAETLGMDGFEISLVSTWADISGSASHWTGQPGTPVFENPSSGGDKDIPEVFWVPTAHIRKGLPFSTELGVTGSYLSSSEIFMLGGEFKIALHEAYFRWVPALSARAAFARLFGSQDLDIITGEIDGVASLPIGLGGMFQITPYAGYGVLFAHVNSQVIDETPYDVRDAQNDQRGGQDGSLYNFPTLDWSDNRLGRFFIGFRVVAAFFEILYEFDLGFIRNGANLASHSLKFGFDM